MAIDLLQELTTITKNIMERAEKFYALDAAILNLKANEFNWSILECLEHLNLYGDFYLPEIEQRMAKSPYPANPTFTSGWLGNYFVNTIMPKENMNKMKTFKSMNPVGSQLSIKTLDKFIAQQQQLLHLLQAAKQVNLSKTKTAVSIAKWIHIKLGDTFRFVVYHNLRHLIQAENVLKTNITNLKK